MSIAAKATQQDREAAAIFLGFKDWDDVMDYRASNQDQDKARALADLFAQRRLDRWGDAPRAGQLDALEWPNFRCGPIAHVYQDIGEFKDADGNDLKKRSEDEQAFVLHKFVRLFLIHGEDWRKLGGVPELDRILALSKREGDVA